MNVYLIRSKAGRVGLTYNKKEAINTAKQTGGTVRFMSRSLYNDGLRGCPGDIIHGWDYPTFYAQSEEFKF
jgi:hypothetical protein